MTDTVEQFLATWAPSYALCAWFVYGNTRLVSRVGDYQPVTLGRVSFPIPADANPDTGYAVGVFSGGEPYKWISLDGEVRPGDTVHAELVDVTRADDDGWDAHFHLSRTAHR